MISNQRPVISGMSAMVPAIRTRVAPNTMFPGKRSNNFPPREPTTYPNERAINK